MNSSRNGREKRAFKIVSSSPLLVGKLINLVPFPGAAYRRIRGVEDSRVLVKNKKREAFAPIISISKNGNPFEGTRPRCDREWNPSKADILCPVTSGISN
ncbi:MAG TPA: hypothetical protein DCW86_00755 [Actinobacteria bacterium]|nr:hypothetical protein [Actinomycetota bacterium]